MTLAMRASNSLSHGWGARSVDGVSVACKTARAHGISWVTVLLAFNFLVGQFAGAVPASPTNFNLCGTSFTDGSGIQWYGSTFITPVSIGASCINTINPIATPLSSCPAPNCVQSQLQQMLQISQTGVNLAYTNIGIGSIGKTQTDYQVTLYFAEYVATAVGQRIFNIVINSATVATNVDIFALAGGQDKAVSLSFMVNSGFRSNFDIYLPTQVGTGSITAGVSFGWATKTSISYMPPSGTIWGAPITLQATISSLNPSLGNITEGSVSFYIDGVLIGGSFAIGQPDGTGIATLNTLSVFFSNCSGGTFEVTAKYLGSNTLPALVWSLGKAFFSLEPQCPSTTPAPTTSTPAPPTKSPVPTTKTPATSTPMPSTTHPTTTSHPPATTASPTTTPTNPTSTPLASSTPPPTTGKVVIVMTAEFSPNPPLPGQPLEISGEAIASSGPPPTGNVTVYVDRVPVASTQVTGSRRRLLTSSSPFSITIIAPSSPGVHIITVVFFPTSGGSGGGSVPVVAPVTVTVNVEGLRANVDLAISSPTLQFPSCTDPVRVVASVTGLYNMTTPTGAVTLSISGLITPVAGATPLSVTLATANITGGAAEFVLHPRSHTAAAVQALTGADKSSSAKLLPGSYQLTAAYSGNALCGPATGSASLDIGATCPLVSLTA